MNGVGVEVGSRVREARKRAGLTQTQLAEAADLALETVSRVERGVQSPTVDNLQTMARVLGTSLSALVGEGGDGGAKAEQLPPEVGRIVHVLCGEPPEQQRRIRRIVELILACGEEA